MASKRRGDGQRGRARNKRLAPPYMPPADADYEASFRALADVQAEAQTRGALTPRLALRRAHAQFALGNYMAAAFDAERAARLDPMSTEAEFLRGQSFLALAAVKHGVARPGVGSPIAPSTLPPRRHLLLTAKRCFDRVLERNPDDLQARKDMAATQALLDDLAGEAGPTELPDAAVAQSMLALQRRRSFPARAASD